MTLFVSWRTARAIIIASSFFVSVISAWGVPSVAVANNKRLHCTPSTSICHSAVRDDDDDDECEELARTTSSTVLRSVLFVPNKNDVSVERVLKLALRSISEGTMRRRVSQLVLGTSIFRQRHEYVYNVTTVTQETTHPRDKIRSMVDRHAAYSLENATSDSDDDNSIPWPSNPVERISLQHSIPHFLVRAWVDEYGMEEATALCRVSNQPGPLTLRRNALCCPSDKALVERLGREENVTLAPTIALPGCLRIVSDRPRSIWAMTAWKEGWFEVQDVGSQLIVAAAADDVHHRRGDDDDEMVVIDYCAGNGGKTLALISQLYDRLQKRNSTVWAHDVVGSRLAQLKGSLPRAGVINSTTVQLYTTSDANEVFQRGMADVVLVDAPCSSCGVLRRRPSHRWEMTQDALEKEFPSLQLDILKNASALVKPGGRLVYATCSICHWENEDVADAFEQYLGLLSDDWEPWPFEHDSWSVQPCSPNDHYCKLLPHKHDSDGFFIARWKRAIE